jgi:photosystem II stability/assembly factor-like uncharacterized protein
MGILLDLGIANLFLLSQSLVQRDNSKLITFIDITLITIIAPNGGEIWEPSTTEFVKWNSLNVTNLKIEFSTNNGSDWNIIYSNISSSLDSINWVIPNTPSQSCLLRISDLNNSQIADTSDSAFIISSGGWSSQNSGISNYMYSIHFINENLGFCVGYDGIILKTTNSGENWELVHYESGLWLTSVYFINNQEGIAVGYPGIVLLTIDGGIGWNQINVNTTRKLNSVYFGNEKKGWIAGDLGTLLITSDGGYNWEFVSPPQSVGLYSISFVDTLIGWIVGEDGFIMKTTDGGLNWSEQISNTSQSLFSVDFVDYLYGWAAGYNGTIIHTTDGGSNWEQQSGTTIWLEAVDFVNRDTGWVSGWYGKLLKTRNGGNFWSTQTIPTNQRITSINFPSEYHGWACDEAGGIFKYSSGIDGITVTKPNGGELIKASSPYSIYWISFGIDSVTIEFSSDAGVNWEVITPAFPANEPPFLWQVPNIQSEECLIKIIDTNSSGTSDISNDVFTINDWGWFQQDISTGNSLNSIYFITQDSGWIAGNGGIIFLTTDGGETWQQEQSGTAENLNSVFFVDNFNGWVAGEDGTLSLTTNSGMNWSLANTGTSEDLKSVYFIDQEIGWASGTNGTIIKTTDGGFNWFALIAPDDYTYHSIFFITPTTGVIVDSDGFVNRTTNGGNTWQYVGSGLYRPLYSVFFSSNLYGYTVGSYGAIKRTSNSGASWISLTEDADIYFRSVHFTHPSTGWVVGLNGVIWNTTNYGTDWYEYSSGTPKNLYSVFFTHPNIGWAVGEGGTLLKYFPPRTESITVLTPNGGENWQHGSTYSITWISTDVENIKIEYSTDDGSSWNIVAQSIPASDQSYQWAIPNTPTLNGRIKLTDVSDETLFDISDTTFAISSEQFGWFKLPIHTDYFLSSAHFENENLGWVVGNYGNILKTTDGGYNWVNQNSGTYDYLTTVEFVDNYIGWTFGIEGTILKTTNGGVNWFSQQGTITSSLESASFVDANNGWALSYYGKIFHTSNGGSYWFQQYQLPDGYYYTIEFINSSKGWVAGNLTPWNESVIYKTTDGGQTWLNSYLNSYTAGVLCLSFTDENYGYGVGIHGVIMRTTNSGNTWSVLTQGFNDWLFSVHCVSQNLAWAVGENGTILYTTNGNNWLNQISGTDETFKSIYMVNAQVGYILSEDGNIYKTNSGGFIPVELENFSASVENSKVTLQWNTSTEMNNYGFNVERSQKLNEEKHLDWKEIGFVPGHGTSTEKHSYSFIDEDIIPGKYQYRLKQIDYDGSFKYSEVIEVSCLQPDRYSLSQNYPNPFNPSTKIKFSIPEVSKVMLKLYNLLGEEVATLVNEEKVAGYYTVEFNASSLSSGVYFYKLQAGSFVETKKMVLMK